jgi:chromosome partitioning protein
LELLYLKAQNSGVKLLTRISAVINQKGGVGKTTTAHALAAGLTADGYKVLAIDTDPQCNLSYGMRADTGGKGIFEALNGSPIAELIQRPDQGHIISSSAQLTGADKIFTEFGMEYLLSEALEPIKENYQYIIIDSPPQLGVLTVNALVACTDIIIPLTADMYAMQGLAQLLTSMGRVKSRSNPAIKIDGILLTRHSRRSVLSRDLKESIEARAAEIGTKVYRDVIRESVSLREAQARQSSVFEYAPRSSAAIDYRGFISEYIKGGNSSHE